MMNDTEQNEIKRKLFDLLCQKVGLCSMYRLSPVRLLTQIKTVSHRGLPNFRAHRRFLLRVGISEPVGADHRRSGIHGRRIVGVVRDPLEDAAGHYGAGVGLSPTVGRPFQAAF